MSEGSVLIKYRGNDLLLTNEQIAELYEASIGVVMKCERLEKKAEKLAEALEDAISCINEYSDRFINPLYGVDWKDASDDCLRDAKRIEKILREYRGEK